MKAGSLWTCSVCGKTVVTEPGAAIQGNHCPDEDCRGEMKYQGGKWIYPCEEEYEKIGSYYQVIVRKVR